MRSHKYLEKSTNFKLVILASSCFTLTEKVREVAASQYKIVRMYISKACLLTGFVFLPQKVFASSITRSKNITLFPHSAGLNAHLCKKKLSTMKKTFKETFSAKGEEILTKIDELIKEGNVRKISIHNKDGKELMSFPLTIGVVGAVLAPVLAAVGALAALIGECNISVEREEKV